MEHVARLLAGKLLKISAINLQPYNSFIWANGWNAPMYTDMRKTLSYPPLRTFIKIQLARLIMEVCATSSERDAFVIKSFTTTTLSPGFRLPSIRFSRP